MEYPKLNRPECVTIEQDSPQHVQPKLNMLNITLASMHPEKKREIDPETGYILNLPNNYLKDPTKSPLRYFSPARKKEFVRIATDLFPDLTTVCEMIGISRCTYNHHYDLDQKFREDMELIKTKRVDKVEKLIFDFSQRPQNFMDRIAVMRAYRGELYNPKTTVTHVKGVSPEEATKRRINLENVIDVEVINSSVEILDAEPEKNLRVPEPLAKEPTQSETVSRAPGGNAPDALRPRDPLSEILE